MEHRLRTRHRIFKISITEMRDKIVVAITCSKYGDFKDTKEFQYWLGSLLEKYDSDPRPLQVTNQHTGQVATVWGDASNFVAAIESRKDIN